MNSLIKTEYIISDSKQVQPNTYQTYYIDIYKENYELLALIPQTVSHVWCFISGCERYNDTQYRCWIYNISNTASTEYVAYMALYKKK